MIIVSCTRLKSFASISRRLVSDDNLHFSWFLLSLRSIVLYFGKVTREIHQCKVLQKDLRKTSETSETGTSESNRVCFFTTLVLFEFVSFTSLSSFLFRLRRISGMQNITTQCTI